MILNIEDIPYVVITNGKTDESKRILETLETRHNYSQRAGYPLFLMVELPAKRNEKAQRNP